MTCFWASSSCDLTDLNCLSTEDLRLEMEVSVEWT